MRQREEEGVNVTEGGRGSEPWTEREGGLNRFVVVGMLIVMR